MNGEGRRNKIRPLPGVEVPEFSVPAGGMGLQRPLRTYTWPEEEDVAFAEQYPPGKIAWYLNRLIESPVTAVQQLKGTPPPVPVQPREAFAEQARLRALQESLAAEPRPEPAPAPEPEPAAAPRIHWQAGVEGPPPVPPGAPMRELEPVPYQGGGDPRAFMGGREDELAGYRRSERYAKPDWTGHKVRRFTNIGNEGRVMDLDVPAEERPGVTVSEAAMAGTPGQDPSSMTPNQWRSHIRQLAQRGEEQMAQQVPMSDQEQADLQRELAEIRARGLVDAYTAQAAGRGQAIDPRLVQYQQAVGGVQSVLGSPEQFVAQDLQTTLFNKPGWEEKSDQEKQGLIQGRTMEALAEYFKMVSSARGLSPF